MARFKGKGEGKYYYVMDNENPQSGRKRFATKDDALKWIGKEKRKADPTKGMSADQKRLYRLQHQIGDPQSLALDSASIYKKLPEYTPGVIKKAELEKAQIEAEKKAKEARKFKPSAMDKSKEFDAYIAGIDPKSIADDIKKIDDQLDIHFTDPKKYKTIIKALKQRRLELIDILEDYERHKAKPKISY